MPRRLAIPIAGTGRKVPLWVWGPLLLGLLSLAGYLLFTNHFAKYFWPKRWGAVEDGRIYRSGLMERNLVKDTLAEHGIRRIVSLEGRDRRCPKQNAMEQAAAELGIEIVRFPMRGTGVPADSDLDVAVGKYAGAVAAIVEARREGKPVLVQCGAGVRRTGGVVACYRMLVQGWDGARAYEELQSYGWHPLPDPLLLPWIRDHMRRIAAKLAEMGVIETVPEPLPVLGPG